MTRLWSSATCAVDLLANDHTLTICNKDGVTLICTRCSGVKNAFSHDAQVVLPWMQTCKCKETAIFQSRTYGFAPNSGGHPTQPLPVPEPHDREQPTSSDMIVAFDIPEHMIRLVNADRKEFGGNTIA